MDTVLPRIARTRSWPVIRGISGLIGMWGRTALFGFSLLEAQCDLGEEFSVGRFRQPGLVWAVAEVEYLLDRAEG